MLRGEESAWPISNNDRLVFTLQTLKEGLSKRFMEPVLCVTGQIHRFFAAKNAAQNDAGDNVGKRNALAAFIFVLLLVLTGVSSVVGADAQIYEAGAGERKVVSKVDPEYPDTLKRLYIGGTVRVEVVVEPNGTVKSTKLLGGSPILGQSTMKAIKQWKYAPAAAEETLTVKIEFDPHR